MPFCYFVIYSFDNDDMKSSKRHVILLSLIFLLKCLSKSFFIKSEICWKLEKTIVVKLLTVITIAHRQKK